MGRYNEAEMMGMRLGLLRLAVNTACCSVPTSPRTQACSHFLYSSNLAPSHHPSIWTHIEGIVALTIDILSEATHLAAEFMVVVAVLQPALRAAPAQEHKISQFATRRIPHCHTNGIVASAVNERSDAHTWRQNSW